MITKDFSNGETGVRIPVSVRDCDVFIVQSTANPDPNRNNMELFIMLHAAKLASPRRITAVVPCMGYARQDRKSQSREPITARLMADFISAAGANRVLTVDLHADQIQGFFNLPVDHLSAENLFVRHIRHRFKTKDMSIVVVSPDAGGVKRVRNVANKLGVDLAIIHKERPRANEVNEDTMKLVGNVQGHTAIIVDDMVDTGGTLLKAAHMLKTKGGAERVVAMATHGVLSGAAFERLHATEDLDVLVVTDTLAVQSRIDAAAGVGHPVGCLEVLSVANLLGEAIRRSHNGESLSDLFLLERDE